MGRVKINRSDEEKRYLIQKKSSRNRRIKFLFSFNEWVAWWEKHLGPDWFSKRGRKKGQFVMARKKDRGPYSRSNSICITSSQNISDALASRPNSMQGKRHSQKTKDLIRKKAIGRKFSPERIAQMRIIFSGEGNPMYGRHHSKKSKRKIGDATIRRNKTRKGK